MEMLTQISILSLHHSTTTTTGVAPMTTSATITTEKDSIIPTIIMIVIAIGGEEAVDPRRSTKVFAERNSNQWSYESSVRD
jgi:hypothetical protein